MYAFEYQRPGSVATAIGAATGDARYLAGGQSLVQSMKLRLSSSSTLVDLAGIDALRGISRDGSSVKIGAMTRLQDIADSPVIKKNYTALSEAARKAASPHVREMGTIAGNICQLNRCWYFRKEENRFDCMRKGGQTCFARTAEGPGVGRRRSSRPSGRMEQTEVRAVSPY